MALPRKWFIALVVSLASLAQAQETQDQLDEQQARNALGAVVRIKVQALPDAHSNATLGTTRDGSGVIIDDKGHILTIGYLVMEADTIEVTTAQGKRSPATLTGYDHDTGFGLLRALVPLDASPIEFGVAASLELREPVIVAPYDSVSLAYVVSTRPFAGSWEYLLESAIFTAPATPAWSGAALISSEGKLLGIGSLLVRNALADDIALPGNMFVPIDLLKPILRDLIEEGRPSGASRPWLGMATAEVQGRLLVTRVSKAAPADRAGIRQGDIILAVGAEDVTSNAQLYRELWALGPAGIEVPLKVLQGSSVNDVPVLSIDRRDYFRVKPTL